MHLKEYTGSIVRATARPESDPDDPRQWTWVEATVWTDRMLAALGNGVQGGIWNASSLSMVFSPYTKPMLRRANPERETADWRAVCAECGPVNRMHSSEGGEDGSPSRPLSSAQTGHSDNYHKQPLTTTKLTWPA